MGTFLPKEEEFAMASIGPESLVAGYLFPQHFIENFKKHVLFDNNELKPENNWKQNFDYFLRKISYSEPGKTLLLKSPGNTGRIKQILSLYPDAKFIHISRNPFDVYQSNVHLYKKLLPLISLQKIQTDEVERFVLESYRLYKQKEYYAHNRRRLYEIQSCGFCQKQTLYQLAIITE